MTMIVILIAIMIMIDNDIDIDIDSNISFIGFALMADSDENSVNDKNCLK